MIDKNKLVLIKIIHTIIWMIMATASFYILYAGIMGISNVVLWIAIGLLLFETIVLMINKWTCPLTPMAGKYTADRRDNFDIYLPQWLAKYNKMIFGVIFCIGLVLFVINWAQGYFI